MTIGATYCLQGHFVEAEEAPPRSWEGVQAAALREFEEENREPPRFCTTCGSANICRCQYCPTKIVYAFRQRPQYCGSCGKPYPWTELALSAAREYADEQDQLVSADKTALKATFEDLTRDTARTPLAAARFKKFMGAVGPSATEVFKKILETVLTEGAKKLTGL